MAKKIEIRTAQEVVCAIPVTKTPARVKLAMTSSHILGNRPRWSHQYSDEDQVHKRACAKLKKLGVTAEHLKKIAAAGVVEIRFPVETENELWASEALPWEHWICAAARDYSIVVVRHLAVDRKATTRKPKTFAFVESGPGHFGNAKNFDAEHDFVRAGLRSLKEADIPKNLTEEKLAAKIAAAKPDVVHFTGIDSLLGAQLDWGYLREEMRFYKKPHHGAHFTNTRKKHEADLKRQDVDPARKKLQNIDYRQVDSRDVAKILNAASKKPLLVSLNAWNSNFRMASRCIAEGAGAVLCFHNSIDEPVARLFYHDFYQALAIMDFDIFEAYTAALEKIRPMTDQVNGSAVILWTAESVVDKHPGAERKKLEKHLDSLEENRSETTFPNSSAEIRDLVGINVEVPESLNYSMLHNGRSLLDKLQLWFRFPNENPSSDDLPNAIRGVDVEVSLQIGPDSFPYQARVELGIATPEVDLADESTCEGIRVPLISELARNLGEFVQTSILVHVQWQGQTLYRQTHSVSLAPANEWKLDLKDSCWIPSFIQPRSPAVSNIIGAAQKYLRCLLDDAEASFDGYQTENVEPQVQAIWTAIAFDYALDYTEPPPSYRTESQRLRTPCNVIAEKRGTCIDLAILFASCLEWIGIYPVLIMNEGHAYPGYWSDTVAHTEFFGGFQDDDGEAIEFDPAKVEIGTQIPWVAGIDSFSKIRKLIHPTHSCDPKELDCGVGSKLRVVESIFLAQRKGLKEASHDATKFFCRKSEHFSEPGSKENDPFAVLIDIKNARSFVTPLPIY